MLRVARFLHSFIRDTNHRVLEEEVGVRVAGAEVPATLFRRPGRAARPGWLVLHGITVPGRHHGMLRRFARSLARAGGVVLIPEIVPWTQLRMDPETADATLAAAAHALAAHDDVLPGGISLVGFSFGATQALITAAHDEGVGEIRSVVGFGGYCDLRRTTEFMMTGEHEWNGTRHRLEPDPYGRWIVAANYLQSTPGYGDMGAVADAARAMAAEAGRVGAYAADPQFDTLKQQLRGNLSRTEREIWDLLAPVTGVTPPLEPARELAAELSETALRIHPNLDPQAILPTLRKRLVLAHGRADHLVPFTETLRMRSLLPSDASVDSYITRLFAHSTEAGNLPAHLYPFELARYVQLLSRALR
jgi:pimeloyl-ACP methyl ester carboxylesterase